MKSKAAFFAALFPALLALATARNRVVLAAEPAPATDKARKALERCPKMDLSDTLCSAPLPSSLSPPRGAKAQQVLLAEGAQVYSCKDKEWYLLTARTDLYRPKEGSEGKVFAGYVYTKTAKDGTAMPRFVFTDPKNDTVLGVVINNRTLSDDMQPAELKDQFWYRRPVVAAKGDRVCNYASVIRTDTKGGAAPEGGCKAGDKDVEVPLTAVYTFYMCRPNKDAKD